MRDAGACGLCLQSPCTCNDEPEVEMAGLSPTCPGCRATVYEGDLGLDDGDSTEVECDKCGMTYIVRLVVSHDYYSKPVRAAEREERGKEKGNG